MRDAIRQKIQAIQAARHQDELRDAKKSHAVRLKIEAALASAQRTQEQAEAPQVIAENVVKNDERVYTLKEAAQICHTTPASLACRLRGRPGFLQYAEGGSIRITESLLKLFIAEAATRGIEHPYAYRKQQR
jgi:hypothetical protein